MMSTFSTEKYDIIRKEIATSLVEVEFTSHDLSKKLLKKHKGIGIDTIRAVLNSLVAESCLEIVRTVKHKKIYYYDPPIEEGYRTDESPVNNTQAKILETMSSVIPAKNVNTALVGVLEQKTASPFYIHLAMVNLFKLNAAIELFKKETRWPMTQIAGDLSARRAEIILSDNAHTIAAALLMADVDPNEYALSNGLDPEDYESFENF